MIRWDTDRRSMSLYTRAYLVGMRLRRDKQAFEGAEHTLSNARELQRHGDSAPTRLTRLLFRVEDDEVAGMVVWKVRSRLRRPKASVIYVHGGGYVHPLTADYWRLVRALTMSPAEVIVLAYPLAPDATIDDVLPPLLDVHTATVRAHPGRSVVLMGDSAGGALVLTMGRRLRDLEQPAPAAVVALSPWLDATLADPEVGDLEPTDPMLAESGLRAAGRWWAGFRSPDDPLVSPVNGSLEGLPRVDVYIGDRDILRPAVDTLVELAKRDGADLHVHEVPAMFHVWMTRAIPEGRRTRHELARLVRRRAGSI
ncbi:MAG: steryl acetyl hydrolase [Marmoricola sp.]|nr:steryl acetyl hydrolase [Marmoricola sp.]